MPNGRKTEIYSPLLRFAFFVFFVIASQLVGEAIQTLKLVYKLVINRSFIFFCGLLRRYAPRNDGGRRQAMFSQ